MIKTAKALASLVKQAQKTKRIAIDTEFVWERTYYPTLGIVQLGFSEEEAFLVDVPAIDDLSALGEILSNPKITKILHDAPQDLTILRRATGAFPKNIFDTRCVAGFVGLSSSISLNGLLNEVLKVNLAKTETRTNWLQRPLTKKQISYALDDVRYLPALQDALLTRARSLGRKSWISEELSNYNNPKLYEDNNIKEQFLKVKGSGRLTPRRRSVLRELAAWRENEARQLNRPRPWVMKDEVLISIAQAKPQSLSELKSVNGISDKTIKRYGTIIMQAVENGLSTPDSDRPTPTAHFSGEESLNARVDFSLAYLKGKSMVEGIDSALVASRADITELVRERDSASPKNQRLLRGWRKKFMGDDLLQLLSGNLAVQLDSETGLPRKAQ